jgi:hypothetical protein
LVAISGIKFSSLGLRESLILLRTKNVVNLDVFRIRRPIGVHPVERVPQIAGCHGVGFRRKPDGASQDRLCGHAERPACLAAAAAARFRLILGLPGEGFGRRKQPLDRARCRPVLAALGGGPVRRGATVLARIPGRRRVRAGGAALRRRAAAVAAAFRQSAGRGRWWRVPRSRSTARGRQPVPRRRAP